MVYLQEMMVLLLMEAMVEVLGSHPFLQSEEQEVSLLDVARVLGLEPLLLLVELEE